jgi:hypothetical protein
MLRLLALESLLHGVLPGQYTIFEYAYRDKSAEQTERTAKGGPREDHRAAGDLARMGVLVCGLIFAEVDYGGVSAGDLDCFGQRGDWGVA